MRSDCTNRDMRPMLSGRAEIGSAPEAVARAVRQAAGPPVGGVTAHTEVAVSGIPVVF